jgi:hypothetical protein
MIRRRSTPRHSFYSRFAAHDSRSSSAYAREQPQPQSPHVFTSRFSGYPGVGGLPPFSTISAHSVLKPTPASAPPDLSGTRQRPPAPIPFRTLHLREVLARRICTHEKRTCNFFRVRTSKTRGLKSFIIRTYEKRPGEKVLLLTTNKGGLMLERLQKLPEPLPIARRHLEEYLETNIREKQSKAQTEKS